MVEINLENDQIQGRYLFGLVDYIPKGVDSLIGNDWPHMLLLQISDYRTTEHAMTDTHDVPPATVVSVSEDEVKEQSDNLNTILLFNVENHITSENERFDCVNDIPSRDFVCDRMLDLTVCADISDNFAEEFSELSPEDAMSDDGITTRIS